MLKAKFIDIETARVETRHVGLVTPATGGFLEPTNHAMHFTDVAHEEGTTMQNTQKGNKFHSDFIGAKAELATIMRTSNILTEQVATVM